MMIMVLLIQSIYMYPNELKKQHLIKKPEKKLSSKSEKLQGFD